jgi:hypothetical protein
VNYKRNIVQEVSLLSGVLITAISFFYAVNKAGYFGIAVEGDLLCRGFPFSYYLFWGGGEYNYFLLVTFVINIFFWSFVSRMVIKLISVSKRRI